MNKVTVKTLALEIQSSVDDLLKKFSNIGIQKTPDDFVTMQEKESLLMHLSLEHTARFNNKLTVKNKTRSTLNIPRNNGKNKSVQIEVRKRRIFIKQDPKKIEYFNIEKEKSQKTEKEKEHSIIIEEKIRNLVQPNSQYKDIEKLKQEFKNNNEVNYEESNKTDQSSFQTEQIHYGNKVKELRNKEEKKALYKPDTKLQYLEKETFHITEKNKNKRNDKVNIEKSINYHAIESHHVQQSKNDNDYEVEKNNRSRNRSKALKTFRQKKSNKHSESKLDREKERYIMRDNKTRKRKNFLLKQKFQKPIQSISRDVVIGEVITVSELANRMAVKSSQVIKTMMKFGIMATINQIINQKIAQKIAEDMGHKVILYQENKLEKEIMHNRNINAIVEPRAPIVTIMGHVDHGKTSLLDYIRSTKVVSKEAGGITQHIGAYHVNTKNGTITFLDTPGHAAFTAMRLRGTQVTDIVVLVVAADDGVMPQTVEAIQHAKSAKVPIIVAINKIDKLEADPDRVRHELSHYNIIPDKWGGDCQFVYVSAKTGIGINELLDAILLQAEILELRAIRKGMASGTIIESFLDKGRGPVATILVREGTLNKGDIVLCGIEYGRIRSMRNETGQEITTAGPSIPVEILGLSGVPEVGHEITVINDEKKARDVASYRYSKLRSAKLLASCKKSNVENMFSNITENEVLNINIILKTDVQGTIEAISNSLLSLSTNEVTIKIIFSGVGGITETDASLAVASNAILIGFNVHVDSSAKRIIDTENLDLRCHSVIYDIIHEMKLMVNSLLSPERKKNIIGFAEVKNVFKSPKFGSIAGCIVKEGIIKRHSSVRILRNKIIIYESELTSLRRFKDDVNEVHSGMECGIGIKNYSDIQSGDIIEVFEIVETKRSVK